MIALLLMKQIVSLFLMMGCGFILVKTGLLKASDSRILSILSIYLTMPCVIIHSFQIEYTPQIRDGFLLAMLAGFLIHTLLLILIPLLGKLFRMERIEMASLTYSNSGNLIIPLVTAILGEEWVIYASAFLCVQLMFLWTHGQSLVQGKRNPSWKKILTNVNLISVLIGLVLFLGKIRLPVLLKNTMSSFAATIGPISMVMIGMLLASVSWKEVFTRPRIYFISALKMLVIPSILLAFLKFSGLASLAANGKTVLLITLLAVITPSATTITQLAQLYNQNPSYASAINAMTTLLCIGTMPLMVMLYLL